MAVLLLVVGAQQPGAEPSAGRPGKKAGWRDQLTPGRRPDEVRKLLGKPNRTCRQILAHRHLEHWLYDAPYRVRIVFDCLRGQKPQLLTVRDLRIAPADHRADPDPP
jgi:hypothetical protein